MLLTMCLQFNINFHLFSPVLQLSQAGREMSSLTRKPALAQVDSCKEELSRCLWHQWVVLFIQKRLQQRFGALQMVAHCQVSRLHTPKPTLALSCTLKAH